MIGIYTQKVKRPSNLILRGIVLVLYRNRIIGSRSAITAIARNRIDGIKNHVNRAARIDIPITMTVRFILLCGLFAFI